MENVKPEPKDFARIFTPRQVQFLEERPKHRTHNAAARAIGINPDTVHVWTSPKRKNGDLFREVLTGLVNEIDVAYLEFDKERHIEEFIIPHSLKRIGEVVTQPIDEDTKTQKAQLIVNTALKVITGRGMLQPEGQTIVAINVMAARAIKENREYKPNWMAPAITVGEQVIESPQSDLRNDLLSEGFSPVLLSEN